MNALITITLIRSVVYGLEYLCSAVIDSGVLTVVHIY